MAKRCSLVWLLVACATHGCRSNGPPPVSCATLAPTCGPMGNSACCDSPSVPGGTFYRSYDVGTDGAHPDRSFPATVSDFRLDKYEVTVGRFRQFVAAGVGTRANPPTAGAGARAQPAGSGWDASWDGELLADTSSLVAALHCDDAYGTWTDAPGARESLPINCISWYEATAFCIWDGGFLPTEAEWNYAAAGGEQQRAYPWSSPPSSLAIDASDATYCLQVSAAGCLDAASNPVGSRPAGDGRWGQSDLTGNVWEWTLDWYASPYPTSTCQDCATLAPAQQRVTRGGGFYDPPPLRAAQRGAADPWARSSDVGVRCARAP